MLSNLFPNYLNNPFVKTSEPTEGYNCIAWAAQDNGKWYEPDPQGIYYWPNNIPRDYRLESYIALYEHLGFIKCDNDNLENEFEKIAIYQNARMEIHASRQLNNDLWTSKLGKEIDVSHTIHAMADGYYGNIIQFMKRPKQV